MLSHLTYSYFNIYFLKINVPPLEGRGIMLYVKYVKLKTLSLNRITITNN